MRDNTRLRFALGLGLVLVLSAVASAPLWHQVHRAERATDRHHTHPGKGAELCSEVTRLPDAGCAICQSERLLSTSLAGQLTDCVGPPPEVGIHDASVFRVGTRDRFSVSARAPPLS